MKETYSPSNLGKAYICPARLRPYKQPSTFQEIYLRNANGRGLFLHKIIELWLKKLNECIQLNECKFLTLDNYLTSINDLRGELASEKIQVHGNISEAIREFRSMTRVGAFLNHLNKIDPIISITVEKTYSDEMNEQYIFEDFFVKGTVDCIIETQKHLFLIDWKLSIDMQSKLFDSYVLQLGLYHKLLELSNPPKQIRLLLVSITQVDERHRELPYIIKTEKILDEFSRINDSEWVNWVQSDEKVPSTQCTYCSYNYSETEFCFERSNDKTIIQNLEVLFGTDPIEDFFDVEIPLTNVRRISATIYEIAHEQKAVEIVFKGLVTLQTSKRKFLRCTGQLRSQNGVMSFFIHQHAVFTV